ncbi:universal stress protein [Streptomyces sp. NPDC052236]|uniref:universal stress protein n=1 Tax=Streptomyces sp. NPDC052236 TaxID=3365686 RepID=UPI0037CDEE16
MSRTVTVGLDGSLESLAAAEWAAAEARLRGLPLKLVNVWEEDPNLPASLLERDTERHWAERVPREAVQTLRLRHPDVKISVEQIAGRPGAVLPTVARDAELLVLGSRGLSSVGGFLVGSVGMTTIARAARPVVLVRAAGSGPEAPAARQAGKGSAAMPYGPVVLGLDLRSPDAAVIEFAFDAALRRGAALYVVHGWSLPPYIAYGLPADPELNAELAVGQAEALTEVMSPWRQKFPDVEVVEASWPGKPAVQLVDASREASLVVIGRRVRRAALGAHIGPVAHAVLHHATAPVAVVPHD